MDRRPLGVAAIGLGAWGPNLARNLAEARGARLVALCDIDPRRLAEIARRHPAARAYVRLRDCLRDPGVQAVAVAVPAGEHARVASAALRAGKDVLVEKPMATSLVEARRMAALAREKGRILGVGHTFEYSPAVDRMRRMVRQGTLGRLRFILSRRLSLGPVRRDVDALWNLAPHDVSILTDLLGTPRRVSARGAADLASLELDFPGGVLAQVQVCWLFPAKIREMILVGERCMLVYDDVAADHKLRLYDRKGGRPASSRSYGEFREIARLGDLHVPRIPETEPLRLECQDFVDACRARRPMRASAARGVLVVAVLEAASRSLRQGGRPVPFHSPR